MQIIFYHRSHFQKPVTWLGLLTCLAFFMLYTQPAFAKSKKRNPVYTVANFEVWGEAAHAVAAKKAALEDGKSVAFHLLLRRLTLYNPQQRLPELKANQVSKLITSLSVRDERNSKTEYLATLDFQFSQKGVKQFLRSTNLAYWDRQGPRVQVIPLVAPELLASQTGEQKALQISLKEWRESWQTLDLKHGLIPLQLGKPLPEMEETFVTALLGGETEKLAILNEATKGKPVVAAILSPGGAANKLRLTVAGRDGLGTLHYKRDHIVSDGDVLQAADFAAEVALGMFETRWKLTKMRPRRTVALQKSLPWNTQLQADAPLSGWEGENIGGRVEMQVQFSGLRQWQSIRQRLTDINGLDDLNIDQLSARGARISCLYPGGAQALQSELAAHNLSLEHDGEVWRLRDG